MEGEKRAKFKVVRTRGATWGPAPGSAFSVAGGTRAWQPKTRSHPHGQRLRTAQTAPASRSTSLFSPRSPAGLLCTETDSTQTDAPSAHREAGQVS